MCLLDCFVVYALRVVKRLSACYCTGQNGTVNVHFSNYALMCGSPSVALSKVFWVASSLRFLQRWRRVQFRRNSRYEAKPPLFGLISGRGVSPTGDCESPVDIVLLLRNCFVIALNADSKAYLQPKLCIYMLFCISYVINWFTLDIYN